MEIKIKAQTEGGVREQQQQQREVRPSCWAWCDHDPVPARLREKRAGVGVRDPGHRPGL